MLPLIPLPADSGGLATTTPAVPTDALATDMPEGEFSAVFALLPEAENASDLLFLAGGAPIVADPTAELDVTAVEADKAEPEGETLLPEGEQAELGSGVVEDLSTQPAPEATTEVQQLPRDAAIAVPGQIGRSPVDQTGRSAVSRADGAVLPNTAAAAPSPGTEPLQRFSNGVFARYTIESQPLPVSDAPSLRAPVSPQNPATQAVTNTVAVSTAPIAVVPPEPDPKLPSLPPAASNATAIVVPPAPVPSSLSDPLMAQLAQLDPKMTAKADIKRDDPPLPPRAAPDLSPAQPPVSASATALMATQVQALQKVELTSDRLADPLMSTGSNDRFLTAAAQTTTPVTPQTTALAQNVAGQMAVAVNAQPGRTIEISLHPRELGNVRMSMTAVDQTITLVVLADRPETADLMRRNIDILAQEFKALGYDNLSFSFGEDGAAADQNETAPDTATGLLSLDEPAPTSTDTQTALPISSAGLDLRI